MSHRPGAGSGQAEVLAWLADPAHYPDRPERVDRLDTHSASVFLAGDRAYKLKRAVRYSFLDFSTLALRRRSCEAELRLNRRTAPGLYLGVTPVTRDAGGRLRLGGEGQIVEWLVVMRRFADDALLDRVAERGAMTPALAQQLASHIAEFHADAVRAPHRGGAAGLRAVVDDNRRALAAAGGVLPVDQVRAVAEACDAEVTRHAARLEARRAGGFVRQCHGDLHLRNIVLMDRGPVLFDAIEFNDEFACIDVWYDMAFLLMDLLARGLPQEANAAFNQYLLHTHDVGGLPLLPLFLGCRAAIRAKTSLAAAALEADDARRQASLARARAYLDLAARIVRPAPPRLVAVGGVSGTGKSTLAARLAPRLGPATGAVMLRSDVLRKVLLHAEPTERLGPEAYAAEVTEEVYRSMLVRASDLLDEGATVIVDATFLDARWREAVERLARQAGVPFTGVWLEAPPETLAGRLRRRTADVSDATEAVLERQLAQGVIEVAWRRLDAGRDADTVAAAALAVVD